MAVNNNLIVSVSPHLSCGEDSAKIMGRVIIALIPAGIAAVILFGLAALWLMLTCVAVCCLSEALIQKLRGVEVTVLDGSAALTGLLLAYCLPPQLPLWMAACGSFVAIAIAKQAFGGLGQNIFNPALVGRAFLLASWPIQMTSWIKPSYTYDAITCASPLADNFVNVTNLDLFLGNRAGCIGEVCIAALLAGGLFLLISGYINWHIPFSFIFTTGIFTWVFAGNGYFHGNWLAHILSGGLILGALFMATDYVTSPLTNKGKLIFGFGCGLLTAVIRIWGGYPEGVCYSILLMNAVTPLIDRYTKPRLFGT